MRRRLTEGVCVGLAIRDTAMVAAGAPCRLRRGPAVLLWLELCAAAAAAGLGLRLVLYKQAVGRVSKLPDSLEVARRAAVGTLFGLHTVRFWIYLQPDQGRRWSGV